MFMSVDLPAPFSPRSACTSPLASSKSTWSFATTPGNRFVIPFSSRRGASPMLGSRRAGGAGYGPPLAQRFLPDLFRELQRSVQDHLLVLVCLVRDVLRDLGADLPEADAVLGQAERGDAAADGLALLDGLDRLEDG